jgi:hypothetical protein
LLLKKIYKMQHLEGSGTPVLYIGRKVLKVKCKNIKCFLFKSYYKYKHDSRKSVFTMPVLVRSLKNRYSPTPVRCVWWLYCPHQCSVGTPIAVWVYVLDVVFIRAEARNQTGWLEIDLLLIRLLLLCYHYVTFCNCSPRYLDLPEMVIYLYIYIYGPPYSFIFVAVYKSKKNWVGWPAHVICSAVIGSWNFGSLWQQKGVKTHLYLAI